MVKGYPFFTGYQEGTPMQNDTHPEILDENEIRNMLVEGDNLLDFWATDGTIHIEIETEMETSGTMEINEPNQIAEKDAMCEINREVIEGTGGEMEVHETPLTDLSQTRMETGTHDGNVCNVAVNYDPDYPHSLTLGEKVNHDIRPECQTNVNHETNENVESNEPQTTIETGVNYERTPERRNDNNDANKTVQINDNVETDKTESSMETQTQNKSSHGKGSENNNCPEKDLYDIFCPECKRGFYHKKLLKTHIIKHHPELRPFSCNICPKSFATNAFLKQVCTVC